MGLEDLGVCCVVTVGLCGLDFCMGVKGGRGSGVFGERGGLRDRESPLDGCEGLG